MKKLIKKVLKIKKGEYLLEIRNNAVATTYSIEHAMDVKNWSLEQLGYIAGNLKKVGYTKTAVVNIYEDDTEEDVEGHTEAPIAQVDNAGFAKSDIGKMALLSKNESVLNKEQQNKLTDSMKLIDKGKLDISNALKSIAKRIKDDSE